MDLKDESRNELIIYVKKNLKLDDDPTKKIDKFLEYFTIMPVDMDPNGIVDKVQTHCKNKRGLYSRTHKITLSTN